MCYDIIWERSPRDSGVRERQTKGKGVERGKLKMLCYKVDHSLVSSAANVSISWGLWGHKRLCLRIYFWDEKSEKNLPFSSHLPLVKICILRHWLLCVSRSHVNGYHAIQAVFHASASTEKLPSRVVLGQCCVCLKVVRIHMKLVYIATAGEKQVSERPRQVSLRGSVSMASSPKHHFHKKDFLIHLVESNICCSN